MKNYLIAAICFLITLSFSACDSGEQTADGETGVATVAGVDSTLTQERQEFLMTAARNIMLQKELAKMALEKSETRNAKAYGQDLMNWATTKQNELQELAQRYGVTLPQQMEDRQIKHIEDVTEVEATNYEYDLELWDSIKDAQKEAIDDFDESLNDVEEADATALTLWSRNTRKELWAHLEQAAAYGLELKNREGGIAEPIVEDINN
ncbi:DUF4142 domain-containing protein [Pontibacter locisalis]|uniref:DUF4142 domain-containing protein n=1 Tax=Pontibacter locisalis TaxID=1719035 RepID=A0ABW5ILF8_9BACT